MGQRFKSKISEYAFDFSDKYVVLCSLYFAITIIMLLTPRFIGDNSVSEFSRQIGIGIIENVDVKKRINGFSCWFAIFCLLFLLFEFFFNKLGKMEKTKECQEMQIFLNDLIIFANCNLLLRCITFFNDYLKIGDAFYFSQYYVFCVVVAVVGFIFFKVDRIMPCERYEQLIITASCGAIPITVAIGRNLGNGKVLLAVTLMLYAFGMLFCVIFKKNLKSERFIIFVAYTVIVFASFPILSSFYIELIHVLNQHYIFVGNPSYLYVILCSVGFFLYVIIGTLLLAKKAMLKCWKNIAFPTIVFGATCLSVQIPISTVYEPDLFEGANASVLISDFLNYGRLPIVEHYGGHMMTGVWEGILYAIINSDYSGIAPVYENLIIPFLALLFYLLLRMIFNSELALFASLFIPFLNNFSYYGLGLLVCLSAMLYLKKPSLKKALLFWGVNIWCALYRLDLGYAFIFASVLAISIFVLLTRELNVVKQQVFALTVWGFICSLLWLIICEIKKINPITRLKEFLSISSSNQNWAYTTIGNTDEVLFGWAYFIIPVTMLILLIYMICSVSFRNSIGVEKWIVLMILNLSYWGNLSRGLVRHSLKENRVDVVFWSAYLFIALFISLYKTKRELFIPVFLGLVILSALIDYDRYFDEEVITDLATSNPESIIESWRSYDHLSDVTAEDGTTFSSVWQKIRYEKKRIQRVELTPELTEYSEKYNNVIDALLDADETYIDLINETLLYSVIGRETPVYISQSPLQLSGEYSQEQYIKEIEGIPIALLPVDIHNAELDGVLNSYRYYKVYEYIYQNYRPLCVVGDDFAIWCLNEKYDYLLAKIGANKTLKSEYGVKIADYGYDSELHVADLGYLPKIWAEYDEYDAIDNKIICQLINENGKYMIENINKVISTDGNYLKIAANNISSEVCEGTVILGYCEGDEFVEKYRYNMYFETGMEEYLIRCSSDYYWYEEQVNSVLIDIDGDLTDISMEVIEGD